MPPSTSTFSPLKIPAHANAASASLEDRVLGMWLGKSIGGTLGLPREGWTNRGEQTFYEPVPTSAPPNDDLELQLVWLHLLEQHGPALDADRLARGWLDHIHYMWDEYGRCRWNLRRGVPPALSGTQDNAFHDGMGSPIRSEIWAAIHPGRPDAAARWAALDASLDHGPEGIAGEVYLANLQSRLLGGAALAESLAAARERLEPRTETAAALDYVAAAHARFPDAPWENRERFLAAFGHDNFTHAPLNLGLTLWALLHGAGDFEKSLLLAVNAGYDTDCTAATVGAILGIAHGAAALPSRWIAPIGHHVFVGPGILGIDAPATLDELTRRTLALAARLGGQPPRADTLLDQEPTPTDPAALVLRDAHGLPLGTWANGELPRPAKRLGRVSWTWRVAPAQFGCPHKLVALADTGAELALDGSVILRSPADLPYVPATHRCPDAAAVWIAPSRETHEITLTLGPAAESRRATALLVDAALHLAAWNAAALPDAPRLPPAPAPLSVR